MEDLDLPESEPASASTPETEPPKADAGPADAQNKNEFDTDSDEYDFDDFSDLLPSDPSHLEEIPEVELSEPEDMADTAPAESPPALDPPPAEEPIPAEEIPAANTPSEAEPLPDTAIPAADDVDLPTLDNLSEEESIPDAEVPAIDDADLPVLDELPEEEPIPDTEIPTIDDADLPTLDTLPEEEPIPDAEVPTIDDADLPVLDEPTEEEPIPDVEVPTIDDADLPALDELPEDVELPDADLPDADEAEIPSVDDLAADLNIPGLEDQPTAEPAAGETLADLELPDVDLPDADEAVIPSVDDLAADLNIPDLEENQPAADEPSEDEAIPDIDLPEADETDADDLVADLNIPDAEDQPAAEMPVEELPSAETPAAEPVAVETPEELNIPEVTIPEPTAADAPEPAQAAVDAPQESTGAEPAPAEAAGVEPTAAEPQAENPEMSTEEDIFNGDIKIPDIGDIDTAADSASDGFSLDAFDAFKVNGESAKAFENEIEKFALTVEDDLALFSKPEVEEIQLSNEEVIRLQRTLAGYPLNLRIACEQIIAEEAVDPAMMAKFIKALVDGAPMREAASLAGKILERSIPIPKGYEKKTGEALEAEHASFGYIFVHKVVPALRLFILVAIVAASLGYLIHRFVYTPLYAESIYRKGYERILAGEYTRANERFNEALSLHRQKKWFYRYAEAFQDSRQFIFAREKYDLLLLNYPRDKKGVMDYAAMETSLSNYKKADSLLRRNILDYKVDDKEALLAVGDNGLAWGDMDHEQYEVARQAYARLLERYGYSAPVLERMMKYFIRIDDLKEVLPLQRYFMGDPKNKVPANKISPETLAELGGYLLDKKFEDVEGVPNEFISRIDGIRDVLIRSIKENPILPEPHYHLARYYRYFKNPQDERITLENAVRFFDEAPEESVRRLNMRIDAEQRYAQVLIDTKEFFNAEDHLKKGIELYEDAINRRLMTQSPQFGRLYADMGDLEYFTKDGNMGTALEYYARSEQSGWAPPEIQYRMGSAYYHQGKWADALERFVDASADMPLNRRLLNALGNASYLRGDYAIAEGYYSHLLDLLNIDRERFPVLMPHDREDHMELAERLMIVRNNFGVTLEALTERTGNNAQRSQALGLYSEAARTWDTITRDPQTMIRLRPGEVAGPGVNLGYLNAQNALHPTSNYERQIYPQIDKDVLEPSPWETLTPQNFRLSDTLF